MGPKKRQREDEESDPEVGPSRASGTQQQKKQKAQQGAGQVPEWWAEADRIHQKHRDRDGPDVTKMKDEGAIEAFALHLAHTPQFIEWIKSPTPLNQISVSFWWLASVHVEGKAKRYTNAQVSGPPRNRCSRMLTVVKALYQSWWNKKFQFDVVGRAQQILLNIVDFAGSKIDNLRAPDPGTGKKDDENRQMLFKLQSTRQRLVMGIHTFTDTQHALATQLRDAIAESKSDGVSDRYDSLVNELSLLEMAKDEFRQRLNASKLNDVGKGVLDTLLENVPADNDDSILYEAYPSSHDYSAHTGYEPHSADVDRPEEESSFASAVPETAKVQAAIEEKFNFTPDYVDLSDDSRLKTEVFTITSATKKNIAEKLQKTPTVEKPIFLTPAEMEQQDGEAAKVHPLPLAA